MAEIETQNTMNNNPNAMAFFDAMFNHWPVVIAICAIVFSWAHFESSLSSLQKEVDQATIQASSANANVNELSGSIREINAKLDILLKKVNL